MKLVPKFSAFVEHDTSFSVPVLSLCIENIGRFIRKEYVGKACLDVRNFRKSLS